MHASSPNRDATFFRALAWVQGIYFAVTGIWPLVSIETFQLVTGQKTDNLPTGREGDHWLVMTVGVLVLAIGVALIVAAWRRSQSPEVAVLAVLSAVGLACIDIVYVARRVILPIYLLDAVAEIILVVAWSGYLVTRRRSV